MWLNGEFAMVIDVRAFDDKTTAKGVVLPGYSSGHIPGSINVPELGICERCV